MYLKSFAIATLMFLIFFPVTISAAEQNFVTPVFPVRNSQYWRQGSDPQYFLKLYNLVRTSNLSSTWLVHYDIINSEFTNQLVQLPNSEIGLFLEVTRKLADDSFVKYDWEHNSWSSAYRVFLSGYEISERERMIDLAFSAFKARFGHYPSAYGAWYVDVASMEYIRDKYGAKVVLGLADQYSTDGYQTWGQYFNAPYYVSKTSAIEPAYDESDSTGILKLQWAPREPTAGFGNSVQSSNFSAQVNDYYRQSGLGSEYFQTLLEDITIKTPGDISQAVIGIEVGELEDKYFSELEKQIKVVSNQVKLGHIKAVTMSEFFRIYHDKYTFLSPPVIMGSSVAAPSIWWYFDRNLRLGVEISTKGAELVDLRFYHHSEYRDNDQTQADSRENLVRLAPAVIDRVALNTSLVLTNRPAQVKTGPGFLRIFSSDGEIIASSSGILVTFPKIESNLFSPDAANSITVDKKNCHNEFGGFAGRLSCLKKWFTQVFSKLPDPVYSKIDGQSYLGVRLDFENMWGVRFPRLGLGKFNFQYPVLDNFISLKRKLAPNFTWEGKQEIELKSYLDLGKIFSKGLFYGQDELLKTPAGHKIFENSYYAVYSQN